MTLKHGFKLTFCGLMITLLSGQAQAFNRVQPTAPDYLEPQMIVPAKDKAFLNSIGMNVDLDSQPVLNIMFLAQDKRGPSYRASLSTTRDGGEITKGLASRSDIINVISLNKATGKWTIFSFYRGMNTPSACGGALAAEENYLTNYYSEYGRRYMIPCLESIVQGALLKHPRLVEAYGAGARTFKIHGFIEGTKEDTLDGLAGAIAKTAAYNSPKLIYIYSYNGLQSALSMIVNKKELSKLMSGQEPEAGKVKVDTDYIYVEAKERYIYAAGGYQRAFNFARLLSDALGWIGYGVYHDSAITGLFADIFDRHFSRTFTLKDFVNATVINGKSALGNAAYRNNMSPVTIVQFGASINTYSIFQNNAFQHFGGGGQLRQLDPAIQILKAPKSVN